MKRRLVLPDTIDKKLILIASKIISGNMDGEIIDTCEDAYNNSHDTISIGSHGSFMGYVPKIWLVPVQEDTL
jgi:hypothetical protein